MLLKTIRERHVVLTFAPSLPPSPQHDFTYYIIIYKIVTVTDMFGVEYYAVQTKNIQYNIIYNICVSLFHLLSPQSAEIYSLILFARMPTYP